MCCCGFCRGTANSHGYFLVQALRYAVEEINSMNLVLPGLTLGYQTYDICSVPASILGTVALSAQQYNKVEVKPSAISLIGPDSSSYAFTPAAALGSFLVPEVLHTCLLLISAYNNLTIISFINYHSFLVKIS